MEAVITNQLLENAISYEQYLGLLSGLLMEEKTTGENQSEAMLNYARMNDKRMKKWTKIGKLSPETQERLLNITSPLTLLVITEGWCGDAAQNLPFIYKMTQLNPLLEMKVILRDEHPEVIDQFLTDGGRSIPKVIAVNPEDLTVLGDWGPRPTVIQNEFLENKKTQERTSDEFAVYLHLWYAQDKGITLQNEFLAKLELWNKKTAIVAGASGLIGRSLTQNLLNSNQYAKVIALVRKPLGISHEKYAELNIDFDQLESMGDFPKADDIFCCLGTTIKKAGSKEAFYKVDFTYPYNLAERALKSGAERYFLVSAMGSDKNSSYFYNRVKGELEDKLSFLAYRTIYIFKPSLLRGNRSESRPGEKFAQLITRIIPFVGPWKKYRPIHADKVADAMMKVAQQHDKGCYYYQSEIMQKM